MKTVSVILASYNGGKYIEEQLDSIFAQTYPIHELLVGDDGSTDNTMAILNNYAYKYKNIKIKYLLKAKTLLFNANDS